MMSLKKVRIGVYLLGISFVLVGLFMRWSVNNTKIKQTTSSQNIKEQLDKVDISGDKFIQQNYSEVKKAFNTGQNDLFSGRKLTHIDINLNFSGENLNIEQLRKLYTQSLINGDQVGQLQILLAMYKLTKDKNILWLGINKAILLNQFDLALELLKEYYSKGFSEVSKDKVDSLLYVLINTDYFIRNKEAFNKLLKALYGKGIISEQEYIFYSSFYLPLNEDFTGYYNVIKYQLLTGQYKDFANQILDQYNTFRQYRDVPQYWLGALISYVWFNNGYFYPAYLLAKKVLKYNPNYSLPLQIAAYTLYLFQNPEAVGYLKKLKDIDEENSDFYKFLMGILYYDLGKYPDAIIYLNELLKKTDFQYRDDVVRYLFLSYIKIENYKKAFELYKEFLQTPSANVYDFWTFFNYFLFNDKGYDIVQNNKKDVLKIIKQCYKSVGKHYIYVCRYGKGLFFWRLGYKKFIPYFKYLIDYYPKPIFFKVLGDYYLQKGDEELAKKYYIMGLQYSSVGSDKEYFRKQLIDIVRKEIRQKLEK